MLSTDGTFFFISFRDWIANGTTHGGSSVTIASVARVPFARLLGAAFAASGGYAAAFAKSYHGSWRQPGIGARSTDLNPNAAYVGNELQVAYDPPLARYFTIVGAGVLVALAESADGLHLTLPVLLRDFRNLPDKPTSYVMPVGTGSDPHQLDAAFLISYTRYPTTGGGWPAATVERFRVQCRLPRAPNAMLVPLSQTRKVSGSWVQIETPLYASPSLYRARYSAR